MRQITKGNTMTKEKDIEKLKALNPGEKTYINWSEESGGVVHRKDAEFELYYVPLYGGDEQFEGSFDLTSIDVIVQKVYSWS